MTENHDPVLTHLKLKGWLGSRETSHQAIRLYKKSQSSEHWFRKAPGLHELVLGLPRVYSFQGNLL